MTEKTLPFDRSIVFQETPFWCGPASAQVVLNSRKIITKESQLADWCGTHAGGTNDVSLIIDRVFNRLVPEARYRRVDMNLGRDPNTAECQRLWNHVVASIDAGYGVIMNWWAPSNNYPRGVKGSGSPRYGGGLVMHYVSCMGYDDDARAVLIADSGFEPREYWVSVDQAALLMTPKAYAYATVGADAAVDVPVTDSPADGSPSDPDPATTLARAMGDRVPLERYRALLPLVAATLQECDCNSVDRIAMWLAQIGHESYGLSAMTEWGSVDYENRGDIGNMFVGDGERYKGRGPIQLTGRANYTAFSKWAQQRGLVATPTFFVDRPELVATDKFGFSSVVWYWTVARNINVFSDGGDLNGATRAINGGHNGLEDRRQRWNLCRNLGLALLALTQPVDDAGAPLTAENVDLRDIRNTIAGVSASGWPAQYRMAYSRHPRAFNDVVADPDRGPWKRRQPDNSEVDGHTNALEQIVPINEQIAWTHTFSDGIVRDSGDVMMELMEFAIQWRTANKLPTSVFTTADEQARSLRDLGRELGSVDMPADAPTDSQPDVQPDGGPPPRKRPGRTPRRRTPVAPKKGRHAWLTCSGTWAKPGEGYPSTTIAQADQNLVFEVPVIAPWTFGPVNNPDPNAPSYKQSVEIGKQWIINWLNENPTQTFGLGGYSQGAECASAIYQELLPGGKLEHRFGHFVGGFSFGDPMRPAGVTGGGAPDPGGAGISTAQVRQPDPRWRYLANGPANGTGLDLYAATPVNNGAGSIIRTFYSMGVDIGLAPPQPMVMAIAKGVMKLLKQQWASLGVLGGIGGLGQMLALGPFEQLVDELLGSPDIPDLDTTKVENANIADAIQAAVLALQFAGSRTEPHVNYERTNAVPGVNHVAHAARHVNAVAAMASA